MDLTSLILFNLTLLAALASPGPALLCALRASLSGGRLQGVLTGAGLATMAALWTLLALLGPDALFVMLPWAYTVLKIVGAVYLLRLAWQTWASADEPISMAPAQRRRAFGQGLLVNLANPKSVLFATSGYLKAKRWLDRACALVLSTLGLRLLFDQR